MSKCQGCGIKLQTEKSNELGYTTNKTKSICERCFRLKNYGEYKTVTLNNEDYQKIINAIPASSLIIYVVDILSLNLKNIPRKENSILAITKYDILPKSTNETKIISSLKKEHPEFLDIICISSLKNYNIDKLYNTITKHHQNNPIFLVGNTNSGKSTLLNKLIQNYDPTNNAQVTVSMYPSTTLDKVEINLNDLTIIDTPGLIEEGNYVNILSQKDLKKITPKKEIKPKSCQITGIGSIAIDNYARIDYETEEKNSFVIYTARGVESKFISYKKNTYQDLCSHKYSLGSNQDIVLPGLGFIKFTNPIKVTLYTNEKIKPYTRNNLI